MANVVPASFTAANPDLFQPEALIRGAGAPNWPTIGAAMNYIQAYMHAAPVVSQGWLDVGGTSLCITTSATFSSMCRWRIPPWLDDNTQTVKISIYASIAGGATSGEVRFQSANEGDSVTLTVAGTGWVQDTLDVEASIGYEEITMDMRAIGGGNVQIRDLSISYVPLSSPLAAGELNDFTAFDEDEFDPDEPLSSDAAHYLFDALAAFRSRVRCYYNWSGLENSTNSNAQTYMDNYRHRVWVPVNQGTLEKGLRLVCYARTANPGGSAAGIRIHHGGNTINAGDSTAWSLPAATALGWQVTGGDIPDTILMAEDRALPSVPHLAGQLCIAPGGNAGLQLATEAQVHSIAMWGE